MLVTLDRDLEHRVRQGFKHSGSDLYRLFFRHILKPTYRLVGQTIDVNLFSSPFQVKPRPFRAFACSFRSFAPWLASKFPDRPVSRLAYARRAPMVCRRE